MGDRISFSFKNGEEESIAFFDHWGGETLIPRVKTYTRILKKDIAEGRVDRAYPLGRLEPCFVMIDFIRWFFRGQKERVSSSYYLGKDKNDGDNSDNGHHIEEL